MIADIIIHGYTLHRLFGWSLHLLTHRPSGPPAESDQLLLTASAPRSLKEALKNSSYNANNTSGKDHNNTNTTLYPHSELKEELSRTHYCIQI